MPDERFVQALMLDLWNRAGSPVEVASLMSLLPQVGRAGVALAVARFGCKEPPPASLFSAPR
jgi:hypothetical protein